MQKVSEALFFDPQQQLGTSFPTLAQPACQSHTLSRSRQNLLPVTMSFV